MADLGSGKLLMAAAAWAVPSWPRWPIQWDVRTFPCNWNGSELPEPMPWSIGVTPKMARGH